MLAGIRGFNKTALKVSKTNPPEDEKPPPRRDPKKPLSMMEEVRGVVVSDSRVAHMM